MKNALLVIPCALALAGCLSTPPALVPALSPGVASALQSGAVQPPQARGTVQAAALPPRASLLPPMSAALPLQGSRSAEPRFDLVVTDAPIHQVLSAIVSDTGFSILLRPRQAPDSTAPKAETITVNLKNVTLFETLDALRELLGYEYTTEGQRIFVQPPELAMRLFQVDYVQGQRRGVSDLQVVVGAAQGGGSSGGGYASTQASALSTHSKSDFWSEVEDATRTALGCQIAKATAGSGGETGASGGGSGESAAAGGASGGARASTSYTGEWQLGERQRGRDGCPEGRSVTVNAMTGTLLVRGMPRELRTVAALLQAMQASVTRQVIIEAKIIDVELNAGSQQGINWAGFKDGLHRFSVGAETTMLGQAATGGGRVQPAKDGTTSLGNFLGGSLTGGTGSAFNAGLGMALQLNNFAALINFLETQGQVHVLSSPRIATLNNQKAVLKVGSEEPFVTNISGGTDRTVGETTVSSQPTLNYQPFFSGIALDVTPQIDSAGNITLHVHTMVNNVSERQKISSPTSGGALVPFAVNNIKETDSVIRTQDNQVVVIGGLMTESASNNDAQVPGLGGAPLVGRLFRKDGRQSAKRELVVLLKPTIVRSDAQWQADLTATRTRIESMGGEVVRRPAALP